MSCDVTLVSSSTVVLMSGISQGIWKLTLVGETEISGTAVPLIFTWTPASVVGPRNEAACPVVDDKFCPCKTKYEPGACKNQA